MALALLPLVVWAAARPAEAGYWLPTFGWPWWPLAPLALLGWSAVRSAPLAARWGVSVPAIGELRTPARWEGWLLTGITLVALGQRLYALGELPAGLWRDEARHGLIALRIWQDPGYRPVYVVEGADLPALLFYLAAPVVGLLGPGVASVRLVSAVAGALAPLALWWAARPLVGPRAALLGAALLAWSSWSLAMSRWGFPATLDQLLTLLAIGFALRALEGVENAKCKMQIPAALDRPFFILHFARAGILGALAAYAYHTGRLAPLTLAALVALRLGADRAAWRRALPGLVAASLAGLLVLAPLLRFIADDFAGYNRRTGAVAFYQEADAPSHAPLLLLLRNAERYLLMWHVAGDRNGRHHAPGAPMVDPVTGALLLAGLGLTLAARGDPARRLLPAWLALGLVPGLLSTGAPHAMRALPALAPACALAGVGLAALLRGLTKDQRPTTKVQAAAVERRHALVVGLSSVVLLTSLALNTWLYFYQMPRDARVQAAFDTSETAMGRVALAAARADDPALRAVRVFVPAGARTSDVLRFLTAGAPVGFFAAETGLSAPPAGQALLLLPAGASDELRAAAVAALGPGAHELAPPRDPSGAPVVLAYGVGQDAARLLEAALSRR